MIERTKEGLWAGWMTRNSNGLSARHFVGSIVKKTASYVPTTYCYIVIVRNWDSSGYSSTTTETRFETLPQAKRFLLGLIKEQRELLGLDAIDPREVW